MISPKGFALLAGVTVVAVGLAGYAVTGREVASTAARPATAMFPDLLAKLNDVGQIRVRGADGTTTLERGDDGKWRVAERGGYFADYAKVRAMALGIAGLQLVEQKTAQPALLPRLDLGDPAAKPAPAPASAPGGEGGAAPPGQPKEVTLLDKGGQTLAAVVVGKKRYGLTGSSQQAVYVRRAGEDQAWLATGELDVPGETAAFLQETVLDLPADEIARVTLGAGGPAPILLAKPDRAAPTFVLQGPVPAGKKPDEEKLERVGGSFAALTLQDVRRLADRPPPADAPRAQIETWDGLRLDATAVKEGEGEGAAWWVSFAPSAEPALAPPPPTAEGQPAPPTGEQRAAALRPQLDGWAFKLPDYLASRLAWGMNDFVTDAQPAS